MRAIDVPPSRFELIIFKWIFMPIILAIVFIMFYQVHQGRAKCESACKVKNYVSFEYIPAGRMNIQEENAIAKQSNN